MVLHTEFPFIRIFYCVHRYSPLTLSRTCCSVNGVSWYLEKYLTNISHFVFKLYIYSHFFSCSRNIHVLQIVFKISHKASHVVFSHGITHCVSLCKIFLLCTQLLSNSRLRRGVDFVLPLSQEEQKLKYNFTKMQINIYHHNNVTAFLNNFKGE